MPLVFEPRGPFTVNIVEVVLVLSYNNSTQTSKQKGLSQ